jgi:hypothetical protein
MTEADLSVPDYLFPSRNGLQIPELDREQGQAQAIVVPVCIWGSMRRTAGTNVGTWAFYTSDYRFENVWRHPEQVVATGVTCCIEVNFSVNDQMPVAQAVWNTYRKRWLARYWQTKGISIIVDLFVLPRYRALNLLGVPKGWRSYATRGVAEAPNWTIESWQQAQEHSQGRALFFVYGGGEVIRAQAQKYGWAWVPDWCVPMKPPEPGESPDDPVNHELFMPSQQELEELEALARSAENDRAGQ